MKYTALTANTHSIAMNKTAYANITYRAGQTGVSITYQATEGTSSDMKYTDVLHKMATLVKTADPNKTILNFQREYKRRYGGYGKPGLTSQQYAKIFPQAERMPGGYIHFYNPQQTTYNWARNNNAHEQYWRDINKQWPNKILNGIGAAFDFIGKPIDRYVDKLLHKPIYADSPGSLRQKQNALGMPTTRKI